MLLFSFPLRLPSEMFPNKAFCKGLIVACFSIALFMILCNFIQAGMIVYGVLNTTRTMTCVSPCILQECDLPENQPYILPTPPIGINVSQALLVGGNIGVALIFAFIVFTICHKRDNFWTPLLLLPSIPFLAAVAWMIVSFIVYTQTIELCAAYKSGWSVNMAPLQWLLGANIVGMIVLIGPYVYVLVCLTVGCLNRTCLENQFTWAFVLFPFCYYVATEPVPETPPTVPDGPPSYYDLCLDGVPVSGENPVPYDDLFTGENPVSNSVHEHTPERQEVSIV